MFGSRFLSVTRQDNDIKFLVFRWSYEIHTFVDAWGSSCYFGRCGSTNNMQTFIDMNGTGVVLKRRGRGEASLSDLCHDYVKKVWQVDICHMVEIFQ